MANFRYFLFFVFFHFCLNDADELIDRLIFAHSNTPNMIHFCISVNNARLRVYAGG